MKTGTNNSCGSWLQVASLWCKFCDVSYLHIWPRFQPVPTAIAIHGHGHTVCHLISSLTDMEVTANIKSKQKTHSFALIYHSTNAGFSIKARFSHKTKILGAVIVLTIFPTQPICSYSTSYGYDPMHDARAKCVWIMVNWSVMIQLDAQQYTLVNQCVNNRSPVGH